MIYCNILYAAILYLFMFVCLSDHLSLAFINVVIFVKVIFQKTIDHYNTICLTYFFCITVAVINKEMDQVNFRVKCCLFRIGYVNVKVNFTPRG